MRKVHTIVMIGLAAALVAGCGVPRESVAVARQQAQAIVAAEDAAAVRAALRGQAGEWERFATLLRKREPGGVRMVDPRLADLADRAAAAARRQAALIEAGQDDPAANAQILAEFRRLWAEAHAYLAQ